MIIFVGDKPSKKNKSTDAFVGASCYPRLLYWIAELDLSINDVAIYNKDHARPYGQGFVYFTDSNLFLDVDFKEDKFVALGKNASKALDDLGLKHFCLPHPSGLNRQINDKNFIKKKLKECKTYLGS